MKRRQSKGPSLNYVSIFEGGRGHKMLTQGRGVYLKCLCKHYDNLSTKVTKKGHSRQPIKFVLASQISQQTFTLTNQLKKISHFFNMRINFEIKRFFRKNFFSNFLNFFLRGGAKICKCLHNYQGGGHEMLTVAYIGGGGCQIWPKTCLRNLRMALLPKI